MFKDQIQFEAAKLQGGQGSGLGLFLSHQIVTAHGGSVTVTSSGVSGFGSTFSVALKATLLEDGVSEQNFETCGEEVPDSDSSIAITIHDFSSSSGAEDEHGLSSSTSELITDLSSSSIGQLRVLVTDDSPMNRKVVLKGLRRAYPDIILDEVCCVVNDNVVELLNVVTGLRWSGSCGEIGSGNARGACV